MTTLALTGATALVAAMATDAWQTTRTGVAVLFGRGGQARQAAIEAQLDGDAALVAQDDDADGARRDLVPAWNRRLTVLLRQHPDAEDDLRTLVAEIQAALPRAQQHWVQTNIARDNGQVFASQGGNVIVHQGPGSGQLHSPTPAPGPDTSSGNAS
jgi:hypothetical protein